MVDKDENGGGSMQSGKSKKWEQKMELDGNEYLRIDSISTSCPIRDCDSLLRKGQSTVYTNGGRPFRFKCPNCSALIDQACPHCGSKEIRKKDGVEDCVRCGSVLRY